MTVQATIKTGFQILAALLATAISAYALNYWLLESSDFLKNKPAEMLSNPAWRVVFYTHITFGAIALFTGGFQFFERLRDRFSAVHRNVGKLYVASVFASSIAGFALALFAEGGLIAKTGFATLAVLWFVTNAKAYTAIRSGRIVEHRTWMIRNYALTFAAVSLRFILPFELAALGMTFTDAFRVVAWACWVPNLLVAELLVARLRSKLVPSQAL